MLDKCEADVVTAAALSCDCRACQNYMEYLDRFSNGNVTPELMSNFLQAKYALEAYRKERDRAATTPQK